jgi:hypothetical protein
MGLFGLYAGKKSLELGFVYPKVLSDFVRRELFGFDGAVNGHNVYAELVGKFLCCVEVWFHRYIILYYCLQCKIDNGESQSLFFIGLGFERPVL